MGRWFADFLSKEGFEVIVSDNNASRLAAFQNDQSIKTASSVEIAEDSDIILLSITIDNFEEAVKEIAPYIRSNQIIFDVTSIKKYPVDIMHQYLCKATILGTHPLFGPGAKTLASQNFVLTPTDKRENQLAEKVTAYLESHEARVTLVTPEEHDEMMSVVLAFPTLYLSWLPTHLLKPGIYTDLNLWGEHLPGSNNAGRKCGIGRP
jgi:prephenate dehydrogenase